MKTIRVRIFCHLLIGSALPVLACNATETGGSQGPPEAPMLYDALPRIQQQALIQAYEVIADHQPCRLDWTHSNRGEGVLSIDSFAWSGSSLTEHRRQNTADGAQDSIETYSVNELDQVESEVWDENADGIAELSKTRVYDDAGRIDEIRIYSDDTLWRTLVHHYDDGGLVESVDEVVDDDIRLVIARAYDADNRLVEETYDHGADGQVEFVFRYQHDASGYRIHEDYDFNNDGSATEARQYEWSPAGLRLSETMYYKGNATSTVEYVYGESSILEGLSYVHQDSPSSTWRASAHYQCE